MTTSVYETIRINLSQAKELMTASLWWKPSRIKAGWIQFNAMREKDIVKALKEQGALVRPLSTSTCEVHVSLTNLTNEQLLDIGLLLNAKKFSEDYAVAIMEAGLTGVLYTPVRDGLFRVKVGTESFYVAMPSTVHLERRVDRVITMFHQFAYQWGKWQATAKVIVVEGLDVLKFENGLSVRMDLSPTTFCQVCWQDEYIDFVSPYEFYWWLKRFF